ncbi:hypothetical protein B0H14DRAFT_3585160 [Mycena olivaceomarginata]|nr:hypothetical protein B0H14DRAFT_3585160 [Mycena olivaceomarginata]
MYATRAQTPSISFVWLRHPTTSTSLTSSASEWRNCVCLAAAPAVTFLHLVPVSSLSTCRQFFFVHQFPGSGYFLLFTPVDQKWPAPGKSDNDVPRVGGPDSRVIFILIRLCVAILTWGVQWVKVTVYIFIWHWGYSFRYSTIPDNLFLPEGVGRPIRAWLIVDEMEGRWATWYKHREEHRVPGAISASEPEKPADLDFAPDVDPTGSAGERLEYKTAVRGFPRQVYRIQMGTQDTRRIEIFLLPAPSPHHPRTSTKVFGAAILAHQCHNIGPGGDAWTNPASQALPLRREGGDGGGFDYGSGAFDAMRYVADRTLSTAFSAPHNSPASVDLSHVQANALTSVQTIPSTESLIVFHQASNSAPVGSINDELPDIFNQLGPNELAGNGTVGDISISAVPSRPPSSASDYSMFEMHPDSWSNPDAASLGHHYSGPPSSGSEWEMYSDYQSNLSRPASASSFPGDFDWHDDLGAFQESISAFAPPVSSDLEQHENDFGTFAESTSNHSALDWDSDLVGTNSPESSFRPDFDDKRSSPDDANTPYELTPDEIDVVIGPTTATIKPSSARDSWPWRDSATVWTDPGVSSRIVDFPNGFPITTKTKVFHIELVNGIPSQFPIPEEPTAFIVCADGLAAEDKMNTIDAILKDYDPHSYMGSTGSRRQPDASLPGSLFGLDPAIEVACRRAESKCTGVVACESLDAAFLSAPRRFPDPVHRQRLIEAEMRTRELQDTSAVGWALTFERSLQSFSCKAILADGTSCKGKALMQQALPPAERYLQSSITRDGRTIIFGIHPELIKNIHRVRTLDCDTTFKPVVGSMDIFEINAWLAAINEAVTLGRVWMEAHDRTIFKQVWEELRRLVVVLTGRPLLFKGLHVRGTILGLNADMEVAPLLGFADAFLPTIDREELRGVVTDAGTLLLFVLRLCYTHIFRGVPDAPHLSKDDHNRIKGFVNLETPQAVEDFKVWIANVPDPDGAIMRWWKQKITHFWLLPAAIQCLSRIPLNDWHTMPATTNLGEAQHARNNAETGTQMGIIESFKKYAEYDARRAAEIKVKLATGNLNHNQNELVHRYTNSNRRHAAAADKGMRARDADERVIALRQAKLQVEAELKQVVAESKLSTDQSNSSGRVPARRSSKGKKAEKIAQGTPNVEQVPRCLSGRVASRSTEPERNAHQEDELQDPQPEKDGQVFQTSDEPSGPRHLRSRGAMVSPTEPPTSARGGGPSNTKRKSTSSATAPAPKPKRRKAGDPLSGWAIELVPGDRTTAVTPREYAQKEPEEFVAQYPQYLKFL